MMLYHKKEITGIFLTALGFWARRNAPMTAKAWRKFLFHSKCKNLTG